MSLDLSNLIESLPDFAFYELSLSGEVRGWSDAAMRLMGFTADEVIGRHVSQFSAQATEAEAIAALQDVKNKGRAETFGWAMRKNGVRFWANEVTMPIRDDSGCAKGFAKVIRDVTNWKAAEDERDRIFTLSADLICVVGFDGFFRRISPSFTRVLGYSEAELLARPYIEFVHPDDVAATQQSASDATAGEHVPTEPFTNRYRHQDGSYRFLEWKYNVVLEDRLFYCVARDVTEQKKIDKKLDEYARELERSNQELQQFAYVASHDLQEPLRAVAGCVQMLGERNKGALDERSIELMGHAVEGARRMQTLINDLLSYSRVGSKGISKAWIDPRPVVDKALRQLKVAIAESDAAITVDPLPQVFADPVQMAQLFQNLIGNAVKFRAEHRPEIRIGAEQGAGEIIFSVRDNGIGIAPEYHDRVFGVFQRLNRRQAYPGTGIGLAICKKIVENHGGKIWLESHAGEGTTFRFSIPEGVK